jgi:hypothetical protein
MDVRTPAQIGDVPRRHIELRIELTIGMMGWMLPCVALLACGCNTVLGLEPTVLGDGSLKSCPPIGETPVYTSFPIQVATSTVNYTFDEARTIAVGARSGMGIVEAPVDSDAFVIADLDRESGEILDQPALAPEGDELFVRRRLGLTTIYDLLHYTRDGARWRRVGTLPIPIGGQDEFSVPTRRGDTRRLVVHAGGAVEEFREYEELDGTWSFVRSYTRSDLGVVMFSDLNITPDGLRLVFRGNDVSIFSDGKLMFADRPDLASPFSAARVMLDLPGDLFYPFMTPECRRLYYVGNGLNYVEL